MQTSYAGLIRYLDPADPAIRSVVDASGSLYPTSPYKILRLAESAFTGQGDEVSVAREELCYAIEKRVSGLDHELPVFKRYILAHGKSMKATSIAGALRSASAPVDYLALLALVSWALAPYVRGLDMSPFRLALLIGAACCLVIGQVAKIASRLIPIHEVSLRGAEADLDGYLLSEFREIVAELAHRRSELRLDPMLRTHTAPTLVELESPLVLPSRGFAELASFLQNHVASAVGVAGPRGAGKSTLLNWLGYSLGPDWVVVDVPASAVRMPAELARIVLDATARKVLNTRESAVLPTGRVPSFRVRPPTRSEEIVRLSQLALDSTGISKAGQRVTKVGLARVGIALERDRQLSWTERDRSHAEWVGTYTEYLVSYRRLGGQPIVIAIDELDKLESVDEAIVAVNFLKDLFHLTGTHFVVSVSQDMLGRFATRGIQFRDAFDSAFDTIVRIPPLEPREAWQILTRRVPGFPLPVAMLCYCWAGGLPRDIIRTARSCVEFRSKKDHAVSIAEITPAILGLDVVVAIRATLDKLYRHGVLRVDVLLNLIQRIEEEGLLLPEIERFDYKSALRNGDLDKEVVESMYALSVCLGIAYEMTLIFCADRPPSEFENSSKLLAVMQTLAYAKAALVDRPEEAQWHLMRARELIANTTEVDHRAE